MSKNVIYNTSEREVTGDYERICKESINRYKVVKLPGFFNTLFKRYGVTVGDGTRYMFKGNHLSCFMMSNYFQQEYTLGAYIMADSLHSKFCTF